MSTAANATSLKSLLVAVLALLLVAQLALAGPLFDDSTMRFGPTKKAMRNSLVRFGKRAAPEPTDASDEIHPVFLAAPGAFRWYGQKTLLNTNPYYYN